MPARPSRLLALVLVLMALLPAGSPVAPASASGAAPPAAPATGSTLARAPDPEAALLEPLPAARALIVDPQTQAVRARYGTELARQTIAARLGGPELALGPQLPLGDGTTLKYPAPDPGDWITAIEGAPDGRVFFARYKGGLRVYAPSDNGSYAGTAIAASPTGLASNNINDLAVLNGELWVATRDAGISVLKFADNSWRRITSSNSSLPSNSVNRLTVAPGPNGTSALWAATGAGAALYHQPNPAGSYLWTVYASGLLNSEINDVAVRVSGNTQEVWVAADSAILRRTGSGAFGEVNPGASCAMMRTASRILVASDGALWFGALQIVPALASAPEPAEQEGPSPQFYDADSLEEGLGICRYTGSWQRFDSSSPGLPAGVAHDMSLDHAGRVWIALQEGAAVYDQGNWKFFKAPQLVDNAVTAIQAFQEGVWFGHGEASTSFYSPNWLRFATPGAQPGALLLEEGVAWVGVGADLQRRVANGTQSFTRPAGSPAISALARDGQGRMWVATAGAGIYEFANNSFTNQQSTADGLPADDVRALLVDAEGRLWAATSGGLALRAGDYWLPLRSADSPLLSDDVRALVGDSQGRLWVATAAGISVLDLDADGSAAWSSHTAGANALPSNDVRALAAEPTGPVWAATSSGLARYDAAAGSWTSYSEPQLGDARALTVDPLGRLWAGLGNGLALREGQSWKRFHLPGSTMQGTAVRALAADENLLWAASGFAVAVRGFVSTPIGNAVPQISSVAPLQGSPGQTITINGSGFDARGPAYNSVKFCCSPAGQKFPFEKASVISATATTLTVLVPNSADSGPLEVSANGLTSNRSADFQLVPVISSVSNTCVSAGDLLEIHGFGLFDGGGAAYVSIGGGPERIADYQENNLIRVYVKAGDKNGPVRVRLSNGKTASSAEPVAVGTPALNPTTAVQQGIEGQPMIWGKRTLVQVGLSAASSCGVRITDGRLFWKKKDGTLEPGGRAYLTRDWGIFFDAVPDPISLDNAVNFVAEFSSPRSNYGSFFPLGQFDGVRVVLRNGFTDVLEVDIPASRFKYIDTAGKFEIDFVSVFSSTFTAAQYPDFAERMSANKANTARLWPLTDIYPQYGPNQWMDHANFSLRYDDFDLNNAGKNSKDQEVDEDDFDDLTDMISDRIDIADNELGIGLYDPGAADPLNSSGGRCCSWDVSVAVNGGVRGTVGHEAGHYLGLVDAAAPNHVDNEGGDHAKYDEGRWYDENKPNNGFADCKTNKTFRQALIDQTGANRRVVLLTSGDPVEVPTNACDGSTITDMAGRTLGRAKSVMAYVPGRNDGNVFFEPFDYNYLLYELCADPSVASWDASYALPSPYASSLCPGYVPPGIFSLRAREAAPEATSGATQTLQLSLRIANGGPLSVTNSYLAPAGARLTPAAPGSAYVARVLAADGTALVELPFEVSFAVADDPSGAQTSSSHGTEAESIRRKLRLPWPAGAARVELRRDAQLLYAAEASPNAPSVSFSAPSGGSFAGDATIGIAWNASDADGDRLFYALEYSADGGSSWQSLAASLTGTSFEWEPFFALASPSALLRVRASDGFNTTTATSAPFELRPRAPLAIIVNPLAGDSYAEGRTISLEGSSLTSGGVDGGSFEWRHNGQPLGQGRVLSATLETPGAHVFSLTVSQGGLTSEPVSVTVSVAADFDGDGLPNAYEEQHRLDRLDATDAGADHDGDGLINLQEYRRGTGPRQADSDGDGASDGDEAQAETNPLDPNSKPATAPALVLGRDAVIIRTAANLPMPAAQAVWITNGGAGQLSWTAASDKPWLTLSAAQGQAPFELRLSVAPGALPVGSHSAQVTVSAAGEGGSRTIPVTVEVTGPLDAAGPGIRLPLVLR
jgi:ligand-binding sensor domain-containing protein